MPTGYTSNIYDSEKEVSFREFVLTCARAFGACIEQRDAPLSEKPKLIEKNSESDYHRENLNECLNWKVPTKKDFKRFVSAQTAEYNERIKQNLALKHRYEKMLCMVERWNPPTKDHESLKDFMISQLNDSIRHDCIGDFFKDELNALRSLTYEKYVDGERKNNKSSIEYHREQLKSEEETITKRNKWITELYKSLEKCEH